MNSKVFGGSKFSTVSTKLVKQIFEAEPISRRFLSRGTFFVIDATTCFVLLLWEKCKPNKSEFRGHLTVRNYIKIFRIVTLKENTYKQVEIVVKKAS